MSLIPTAGGLKPCPFCGHTEIAVYKNCCMCKKCGAANEDFGDLNLPLKECGSMAIKSWNTRTPLPTAPLGEDEKIVRDFLVNCLECIGGRLGDMAGPAIDAFDRLTSQPKPDERTLPELPEGYYFEKICSLFDDNSHGFWCALRHSSISGKWEGSGFTPCAAVLAALAAIERIK